MERIEFLIDLLRGKEKAVYDEGSFEPCEFEKVNILESPFAYTKWS